MKHTGMWIILSGALLIFTTARSATPQSKDLSFDLLKASGLTKACKETSQKDFQSVTSVRVGAGKTEAKEGRQEKKEADAQRN